MQRKADFGGIVEETFTLAGEAFVYLLGFVIVVGGLAAVGEIGGGTDPSQLWGFGVAFNADTTVWGVIAALAAIVAQIVGGYLVLERMLELRGRLNSAGMRIWAYLGLSILTGLGTILGLVLLIVPGLILMVRWSAAPAFLIGRNMTVDDAMRESWVATKGHGWPIFFAGLVCFLLAVVPVVVITGIADFADAGRVGAAIGSGFADATTSVLSFPFAIAVFVLLDEGVEEIEQVFA